MTKIPENTKELHEYLTDMESRIAFQEKTIDALNEMVTKQWAIIDKMEKKFQILDSQLYELEMQQNPPNKDAETPPHY